MKRSAIFLLAALAFMGWSGADAGASGAREAGSKLSAATRAPWSEVLAGAVVVQRAATSGDVVVAVDAGMPDGIADRVFVLQRDAAPSGAQTLRFAQARVLVEGGGVVVAPVDGSPAVGLFLQQTGGTLSPTASAFLGATALGTRWSGHGLARRGGEVRIDAEGLSQSTLARVLSSCGSGKAAQGEAGLSKAAAPAAQCPGGGSTDCTNSTCQILCIPGYVACCDCTDPNNCKCRCVRQ